MPTVREYETALQRNPADTEAFVALRKAYRQAQKHDKLVTLYETRAQGIEDGPKAAELFYLAAELRIDQLGDGEGAEVDLANAVDRDPTHIRAAARLKDIYREQGRTADYMTMLEMEAAAVAKTRDPARIAELQSEMGQLFVNHFARLERSVRNAQRPGKLNQDNVKSIESARKIYRALGDYRAVVRLYELELEGTTEAKRRADLLLGLGRVLSEKLEELDAAAQRLGEVIRLRPRDEKALELLAAIYANPNWIGADGLERAAAIYFQIARRRQEAGDADNAVAALRRALQAMPGHPESSELLERVYYDGRRYQDLDRYYRERISAATSEPERIDFLYKRAQLAEGEMNDPAEAQRVYGEITPLEPPNGPAAARLVELFLASHDYAKLAELRERQLGAIEEPGERVRIMSELAALYRDRLGDRDQSAVYLHAILQIDPENLAALSAYADHFRDKGDWNALADLLEFSFERSRVRGGVVEEQVRRLEEIAVVSEKSLGDVERALHAWRRVEELAPTYARAREAQRRLLLKGKSWDRMAALLEREAALQEDPAQRAETLRRVAQIQREKLGDPAKAVEIYKGILRAEPHDAVALRALVEIYEREGDFAGLAKTLREQIDLTPAKQERVSLLRRLVVIYDERLSNLAEAAWAASEILQTVPGDRDTLTRLEGILERAGDVRQLVQVLEQHTKFPANPDEKIQLVRRIAELVQTKLHDLPGAAARWEEIAHLDPDDAKALDSLTTIYTTLERYGDLARVLDMQVERVVADPMEQAAFLRRLAALAEGPLNDIRRAQRCWENICEVLPSDTEALDALSRIYSGEGDWATLVRILEKQIPLARDPVRAVELALLRAQIFDERLHNAEDSARVLEQVIAELNPRSWEAHERLRALYEKAQSWARVVKVAERQLFLIEDPAERTPRALELAVLWRDRLRDAKKATAAFERVLEIDPDNLDALRALAPLYQSAENFERLIFTDEKLLDQTEDPTARRALILEIARLCEDELAEPRLAFEWYKRAYNENADAESLQLIDRVAEKHGLYEDLIQIYEGARARAVEAIEQLAAALKIALICEEKLNDSGRAFAILRDTLHADPAGRELLPNLERLAEQTKDWAGLLDVYARVARARPETAERVELLRLRAGVRERHLDDPSGAMDESLRSFALSPENATTQDEILRLAKITSRWEDALKVQGQLFAMAEDHAAKLAVARNAAYLVEHEVKDPIRAFRAYLNAFRLAPEDPEVTGHLWRLAALIGRYEPAPHISAKVARRLDALEAYGGDDSGGEVEAGEMLDSQSLLGEPTSDSSDEDVLPRGDADDDEALVETAPHRTSRSARGGQPSDGQGESESESEDVDLADVVEDEDAGALAVEEIGDAEILDEIEAPSEESPSTTSALPASLPPPSPSGTRRGPGFGVTFETPWEELAQAYEALPADDQKGRHAYLLKIAEVWERGQHDVVRALGALERAFNLEPANVTVRAELQRIGREYNEWDRISEIYLGAVDEFGPIENAVALHHDVARFRDALGQIDKSEELYNAILSLKSDDVTALDRIEQIYRSQERWGDLSNLLERRTSGPTEALPHGPERRAKFRELAELYESRLEKPYEAIDTLERFVTETASHEDRGNVEGLDDDDDRASSVEERIGAYEALTRLYSRVGLWANVVETLQHQAELTKDRDKARNLRLRIANVYEKELGLAERAVDAYEGLLEQIPDEPQALAALDHLHEAHGHFEDLQVILGRRAAAATGAERHELVRRRAKILEEKLGNPEAAASCLRELGVDAVHDDEMMAALIRNLRRAGLAHEAARILSQKIDMEKAAGDDEASRTRVTGLSLELSLLKLDDLNDAQGARAEVEAALAASPSNPAALAAMARLYLKENDFAGYAEARIREAKALAGKPEAVAALLDAGRVFREQIGAPEKAQICFEEALKEDPRNAAALRSLAALLASQGAWEEATTVLSRQLEISESPEARAAVLTDLGRAAWEGSADAALAQKYLDEALSLVPDHIPAVIGIADIYYKENLWEQAERRLTEAIRKLRGQPQQMVRLYQRLAEVHEKLGKLEEAYRQLLEADRMGPGQLVTKLSLGENRFRAGKWREAALHLAGLADHPDAAIYPDEVADALAHGAQSEIKLRRPERAIALYEAALRLRNGHGPSLRALADLALERGEKPQAAIYLRRMAEASSDRAERSDLLEQVGDRYLELGDATQALAAYEEALKVIAPPTEAQVALLEKALKLQREAGHDEVAARTSSLLIDLVKDPKERAVRRREAALMLAKRGDTAEAGRLLQQALDDRPQDEEALAGLCDVWPALGKDAELEKMLRKTLPGLPPVGDTAAATDTRARLWEKLGELQARRDPPVALASYERVVEIQPGRISARLALSNLYGDRPEFAESAIQNHRILIEEDISRTDSLRALGNAYARRGLTDRARCCFEVLSLFGAAQAEEIAFLDAHPAPAFKADDPYATSIDANDRKSHLALPEATIMGEIFSCLSEGAPGLIGHRIEELGVSAQDKISPMSDLDVGKIYGQIAKALGNKKTGLYLKNEEATASEDQIQIVVQAPPALVIGLRLAQEAPHSEVRFQVGRGLELTRPEYILAAGIRPKQFTQLFSSVLKAFHPRHSRRRANATDAAEELAAKLKKNVPYKVSKRLVELFQELGSTSWSSVRWRAVVHQTGNRAGLLLCSDLRTAAKIILSERAGAGTDEHSPEELIELAKSYDPFGDLVRFALSDDYFLLREKIGTAVASAVAA